MEFLVRIAIELPSDLADEARSELERAEQARAAELAAAGVLVRLWRVPGRRANVGLWSATDATELHEALASLPMWNYMTVDVEPLAAHRSDPPAT